ncbi:hypothetical protein EHS25_008696 [Saitozyma podzolica]|uniref:Uncharacterized protein n=1 Tax=Saitozyma podzolica TaxID=1890683 RepID=A0A427YMK6_9TREE|nr:hypothetical protein EHS25_008696 [Saitozyma podzolica]
MAFATCCILSSLYIPINSSDLRVGCTRAQMPTIPFPRHSARRDSSSSSVSYPSDTSSEDDEAAMIQEEWEESLRQMEVVLSIIIMPFFGKWYGRRWAYWAWERYQVVGLGKAFFGLR